MSTFVEQLLAIPDNTAIDIYTSTSAYSLDVIGKTAFGTELHALEGQANRMTEMVNKFLAPKNPLPVLLLTYFPAIRPFLGGMATEAVKYVDGEALKIIETRKLDAKAHEKHDVRKLSAISFSLSLKNFTHKMFFYI